MKKRPYKLSCRTVHNLGISTANHSHEHQKKTTHHIIAQEGSPLWELNQASIPISAEDQGADRIRFTICTMSVHLAARIALLDVDLGLVHPSCDLDEIVGMNEVGTLNCVARNQARSVTSLSAIGYLGSDVPVSTERSRFCQVGRELTAYLSVSPMVPMDGGAKRQLRYIPVSASVHHLLASEKSASQVIQAIYVDRYKASTSEFQSPLKRPQPRNASAYFGICFQVSQGIFRNHCTHIALLQSEEEGCWDHQ